LFLYRKYVDLCAIRLLYYAQVLCVEYVTHVETKVELPPHFSLYNSLPSGI